MFFLSVFEIQSRWKNIKDSNTRSQKKLKGKSGAAASGSKKYVFSDLLTFLQKTTENRPTEDSFETEVNHDSDNSEREVDNEMEASTSTSPSQTSAASASSAQQQT